MPCPDYLSVPSRTGWLPVISNRQQGKDFPAYPKPLDNIHPYSSS